jgi:hypothetical protein
LEAGSKGRLDVALLLWVRHVYELSRGFPMKKVLIPLVAWSLLLFLGGMVRVGAAAPATVSGYISDSICGAKGAMPSHADCMKKCLDKGASIVIVVDDTHRVLTIDNPDTVKGHEGHRVLLTGDINAGTIHVYSLRII